MTTQENLERLKNRKRALEICFREEVSNWAYRAKNEHSSASDDKIYKSCLENLCQNTLVEEIQKELHFVNLELCVLLSLMGTKWGNEK